MNITICPSARAEIQKAFDRDRAPGTEYNLYDYAIALAWKAAENLNAEHAEKTRRLTALGELTNSGSQTSNVTTNPNPSALPL